jgi:hypothetical protein
MTAGSPVNERLPVLAVVSPQANNEHRSASQLPSEAGLTQTERHRGLDTCARTPGTPRPTATVESAAEFASKRSVLQCPHRLGNRIPRVATQIPMAARTVSVRCRNICQLKQTLRHRPCDCTFAFLAAASFRCLALNALARPATPPPCSKNSSSCDDGIVLAFA